MEGNISGSFPGGPRKQVAAAERTSAPRLSRVEAIEEQATGRLVRRKEDRRRRRIMYAVLVSVAISATTGVILGMHNRSSLEEVRAQMAAQQAAESGGDMGALSSEVNRAMLELWKMEDVEYARNSR
ncbi:MAG TPA: hypothetical protein EYQ27_11885 [Gemmatimonadetes bacterium]|nr:hypothetical protein [Gemmatimonadota bacterium]